MASSTAPSSPPPAATAADVLACMLPSWYERFRACTFRTEFIPLSADFMAYLAEDGIVLPEVPPGVILSAKDPRHESFGAGDADDDDEDWGDDDEDGGVGGEAVAGAGGALAGDDDADDADVDAGDNPAPKRVFVELEGAITAALARLGGAAFPKLNWSSPRDAAWVVTGGLKCETSGQVLLLLKSSDFVSHDLGHAFELCGGDASPGAAVVATAAAAVDNDNVEEGAGSPESKGEKRLLQAKCAGAGSGGRDEKEDESKVAADSTSSSSSSSCSTSSLPGAAAAAAVVVDGRPPDGYVLALRRWGNMNPAMEFRCFVRQGVLVGACQRECSEVFDFLVEDLTKGAIEEVEEETADGALDAAAAAAAADDDDDDGNDDEAATAGDGESLIRNAILDFFEEKVSGRFGGGPGETGSYVFDVYVDRRRKVWLVDFNPFGTQTDPILFDWNEAPLLVTASPPGRSEAAAGGAGAGAGGASSSAAAGVLESAAAAAAAAGGAAAAAAGGTYGSTVIADDFECRFVTDRGQTKAGTLDMHRVPADWVNSPDDCMASLQAMVAAQELEHRRQQQQQQQ